MDAETPALPGSLRQTSTSPFVGRATELEKLRTLMPRAAGEGRRVALLAGEPGAGKSRLTREFAAEVAAEGALVLYGACDAAVRTPYRPFVEALEQLVRAADPDDLRATLGTGGGELTRLLPDLSARVGELPEPVDAEPETERHRLHTAVADLLENVSRERPLLVVLEDGHWADAPTLLMLRHLARSAAAGRMLLLATFRDTEADVPAGLAETLADLRRAEGVVRMRLAGLSGAEVSDLVSRAAGGDPGAELDQLASTIHDLTGGNAFLVCELWRALLETGTVEICAGEVTVTRPLSELGTPESVHEVVGQRLSRLAPKTTDLLELAAVAGPEFELAAVRRAAGLTEEELLAAHEEAVGSGMIEELRSQRLACRFTHEIVRRALYDRLSRPRRAELHLRVGEELERSGASDLALADLAHHFGAAAPLGGAERAVDYNLRAARAASAALAFDDAESRLRTAIEIGIEEEAERASVLLELGSASHRAGKATDAQDAFAAAAEIARRLGSAELLAQAAIGYEEACWRPGIASRISIELLEEALTAVGEGDADLRIGLLAGLARALSFAGEPARGLVVHGNAIELAREHGDRRALARVLIRSYWARGTTPLEEILATLTEARDLAEEIGDVETQNEAMAWRVPTFVALGDLDSAREEVAVQLEMAERTAQPFMNHVAEHSSSAIALCQGNLAEAEELAERSHDWGRLLVGRDASGTYGIQMFSLRREQGRLAELAPAMRILAGAVDREGPWRPGLAAVLAELGMEREAKRELAALASDGIEGFRTSIWTATLVYLADACAALDDETMAAIVYPELEPLAGANVMIGHLVACYGAADRYLGMLAATLKEPDRAEEHFERAMDSNRRMGARTWLAHTAYEYGRFLVDRGGAGRERGGALLGEATALAEQIGMEGLLAKIRGLGVGAVAVDLPGSLSPREVQILALVAEGLSNREIGGRLTISEHTAANHIRSILRKTESANRTEAASYAHRHGLVSR